MSLTMMVALRGGAKSSSIDSNNADELKNEKEKKKNKKKKFGTTPETVQFIRDLCMGILSFF